MNRHDQTLAFNHLVEQADHLTDYRHDENSVEFLYDALCEGGWHATAISLREAAIPLGYFQPEVPLGYSALDPETGITRMRTKQNSMTKLYTLKAIVEIVGETVDDCDEKINELIANVEDKEISLDIVDEQTIVS